MKAKKLLLSLLCFMIIISLLACLSAGCKRDLKVYRDGYFEYVIVGENGGQPDKNNRAVVAIIGFTSSGMQQELIDFPKEIDGKPVQYIGYRNPRTAAPSYYHLESDNLKKVYIHENIKSVFSEAFLYFSENNIALEFMVCEAKSPYEIFAEHYFGEFYTYKSLYESNDFDENIHRANIVFMNNYSTEVNEGYYSLDNIEAGWKIPAPTKPLRSGYKFTGWYTEPECINSWDFDVSPTIEEGAEFRLYAGWRETGLEFSSLDEYIEYFQDREIAENGTIIVFLNDEASERIEDYTTDDFSEVNAVSIEKLNSIKCIFVTISETDRDSVLRASYILHLRSDIKLAQPDIIQYPIDDC